MTTLLCFLFIANIQVHQGTSIALIAAAVIGASATVYGANKSAQTAKANRQNASAFNEAQALSEAEARKLYDGLIVDYNKSKEKLQKKMSLREYVGNAIATIGDPVLKQKYYESRNEDWVVAQKWADEASTQNISVFNKLVDNIGGGSYQKLIAARNQSILGEDINAVYDRAQELRSSKIPAGSVKKTADGQIAPNTRADKFNFGISYDVVRDSNDRIFQKSSNAIESDRGAAQRQQERAISFMPMLNYSEFSTNAVLQPFNQAQLASSLAILNNDASLAQAALGKAVQNPQAPIVGSTASSDALAAGGAKLAIAALGQYYSDNKAQASTTAPAATSATSPYASSAVDTTGNGISGNGGFSYSGNF